MFGGEEPAGVPSSSSSSVNRPDVSIGESVTMAFIILALRIELVRLHDH
jgi:hypothetical protein